MIKLMCVTKVILRVPNRRFFPRINLPAQMGQAAHVNWALWFVGWAFVFLLVYFHTFDKRNITKVRKKIQNREKGTNGAGRTQLGLVKHGILVCQQIKDILNYTLKQVMKMYPNVPNHTDVIILSVMLASEISLKWKNTLTVCMKEKDPFHAIFAVNHLKEILI